MFSCQIRLSVTFYTCRVITFVVDVLTSMVSYSLCIRIVRFFIFAFSRLITGVKPVVTRRDEPAGAVDQFDPMEVVCGACSDVTIDQESQQGNNCCDAALQTYPMN